MVTARRENTTCDIRSNGAYGIIVGQERNQVMDSGGMPGASPKKERNRVRRFRDIGRALCRCSIIANRERCVNPPVRRVMPSCDAFPSRFRAGRNRRRNGSQLQHHYLRQFSKQPSRGPSPVAAACCHFRHAAVMDESSYPRNRGSLGQPGCASIGGLGRPTEPDKAAGLRHKEAERGWCGRVVAA